MGNKYAVVEVNADGVNPEVFTFNDKGKVREFLKEFWNETKSAGFDTPEAWCDEEGDYAKIIWQKDDWNYFQVVDVKNATENPYMPFDIDDTVYYMEKVSERGGHPGYKIVKTKCAGYWNLGDGWKIAFKDRKCKLSITEIKSLPVADVGYTIFDSKASLEERIKELNGFIVE